MMPLKQAEIDHIIELIKQIKDALIKSDFLTPKEHRQLKRYISYEKWRNLVMQVSKIDGRRLSKNENDEDNRRRSEINYDPDASQALKDKLPKARTEHINSIIRPLQEKLKLYLVPRWDDIWPHTTQAQNNPSYKVDRRAYGNVKYELQLNLEKFFQDNLVESTINEIYSKVMDELKCVEVILKYSKAKIKSGQKVKPVQKQQRNISGMPWQEAKSKAEEYLKTNTHPGSDEKLGKIIGCSGGTITKATGKSKIIQEAKRRRKSKAQRKTLPAVNLSEKIIAKQEQTTEPPPEDAAYKKMLIDEILQLMKKAESEERSSPQKNKTLQETRLTLEGSTVEELEKLRDAYRNHEEYNTHYKKA